MKKDLSLIHYIKNLLSVLCLIISVCMILMGTIAAQAEYDDGSVPVKASLSSPYHDYIDAGERKAIEFSIPETGIYSLSIESDNNYAYITSLHRSDNPYEQISLYKFYAVAGTDFFCEILTSLSSQEQGEFGEIGFTLSLDKQSIQTLSSDVPLELNEIEQGSAVEECFFYPEQSGTYYSFSSNPILETYLLELDEGTGRMIPPKKRQTGTHGSLGAIEGSVSTFDVEAGKPYLIKFSINSSANSVGEIFAEVGKVRELCPGMEIQASDYAHYPKYKFVDFMFTAKYTGTYSLFCKNGFADEMVVQESTDSENFFKHDYTTTKIDTGKALNDDGSLRDYYNSYVTIPVERGKSYILFFSYWDDHSKVKNKVSFTLNSDPYSAEGVLSKIEYKPVTKHTIVARSQVWEKSKSGSFTYQYEPPAFNSGDELIATHSDGTKASFIYDEQDHIFKNSEMSASFVPKVTAPKQWTESGINNCIIEYKGKVCNMPVEIIPGDLKSISYKCKSTRKIMEHDCGEWKGKGKNKYFYYYEQETREGDKLTLEFNDGSKREYIYTPNGETFKSTEDNSELEYSVHIYDNQTKKHWKVGKNKFTVACLDKKCTATVTITENPYKSISLVHSGKYKVKYKKDGMTVNPKDVGISKKKFFAYTLHPVKGDKLVLTKKNGKKETYTCKIKKEDGLTEYLFVRKGGRTIDWYDVNRAYYYGGQIEKHWKVGKNSYKMQYLGIDFKVPVYVVKK